MNDLMGLAITEGVEEALTVHQTTGLGCWAAGSAPLMHSLGDAVPSYVDCVTVVADPNAAGERGARILAKALFARGLHADVISSRIDHGR